VSDLKPIADQVCADCGKPLDLLSGETFRADTTGRVWHYGCGRGRASPTNDGEGLIEALAALDEVWATVELEGETGRAISKARKAILAALNQGTGQ
jgi:hypothetical protein